MYFKTEELRGERWPLGGGEGAWQARAAGVRERMRYLRKNRYHA